MDCRWPSPSLPLWVSAMATPGFSADSRQGLLMGFPGPPGLWTSHPKPPLIPALFGWGPGWRCLPVWSGWFLSKQRLWVAGGEALSWGTVLIWIPPEAGSEQGFDSNASSWLGEWSQETPREVGRWAGEWGNNMKSVINRLPHGQLELTPTGELTVPLGVEVWEVQGRCSHSLSSVVGWGLLGSGNWFLAFQASPWDKLIPRARGTLRQGDGDAGSVESCRLSWKRGREQHLQCLLRGGGQVSTVRHWRTQCVRAGLAHGTGWRCLKLANCLLPQGNLKIRCGFASNSCNL